jgi:hypothetical protein
MKILSKKRMVSLIGAFLEELQVICIITSSVAVQEAVQSLPVLSTVLFMEQ